MPSSLDAHARNSAIRRVQSTGDIPREPRPLYKPQPEEAPHSARHSDLRDDSDQAGQGSSSSSSPPPNVTVNTTPNVAEYLPPVTWTPQPTTIQPLERLQTQLPPGPAVRHVAPTRQHSRSLYRRSLAFLGLGRGASPERRSLMGLLFNLISGFSQVCSIYHTSLKDRVTEGKHKRLSLL